MIEEFWLDCDRAIARKKELELDRLYATIIRIPTMDGGPVWLIRANFPDDP